MKISEFHKYNRLVRRGLAEPLACPHDGHTYTLRATRDAEPVLECFNCLSKVQPGLKIYDRITAINKEFYNV